MAGWAGNDPAPIPQWATHRAQQELGSALTPDQFLRAFARYIALHEQPPVDPDVIAVREILAAFSDHFDIAGWRDAGTEFRDGEHDEQPFFAASLTAYRKHKEAGK